MQADSEKPAQDSGLLALVMLARFHEVAADPEQVRHHFGTHGKPLDERDLVRAAPRST